MTSTCSPKHVETWQSRALLEAVWAAGLPAEPMLPPGGCWDDPQVQHNAHHRAGRGRRALVGHPLARASRGGAQAQCRRTAAAPLAGVKVIDFGAFVAGPYTSAMLADMGADVIKVEPMTGDPNRSIFRSWTSSNRGKRCITIDLKTPEGLKIAQQLCVAADVVTSNFRPGVSARLGIDAQTAARTEAGPDRARKRGLRHDRSAGRRRRIRHVFPGALRSRLARAAESAIAPLWNRTSMVDFAAGSLGAVGVLQHLYQRARTGAGAELVPGC